jgi:hypothetical protein
VGILVGRQIVIACLLVTGTPLLCRDAWFDVVLDLQTGGLWPSIAVAVVIESPLAFLLLTAARRLVWLAALVAVSERDGDVHLPSLWRMPLVGENAGEKAGERE